MTDEKPSSQPDERPKKRKRLTKEQSKIARLRVKYPDATQQEIADKVPTARTHVVETLNRPHVRARVQDLMDASPKLRVPSLLKKLEEGLDATFVKVFKSDDDVVIESREYDDMPTRHRYLDTALELQGLKGKNLLPDELPDGATFTLTIKT